MLGEVAVMVVVVVVVVVVEESVGGGLSGRDNVSISVADGIPSCGSAVMCWR